MSRCMVVFYCNKDWQILLPTGQFKRNTANDGQVLYFVIGFHYILYVLYVYVVCYIFFILYVLLVSYNTTHLTLFRHLELVLSPFECKRESPLNPNYSPYEGFYPFASYVTTFSFW